MTVLKMMVLEYDDTFNLLKTIQYRHIPVLALPSTVIFQYSHCPQYTFSLP